MQRKLPSLSSAFPSKRKSVSRTCAGFLLHFLSRHCKLPFAVCICTCEENEGLQREYSFCRGVSNRGASSPVGTRFSIGKSSVLYLCFRLARKRGLTAHSAVRQSVATNAFCGSRTGGFCGVSYSTIAGFLRSKIRLAGEESRGIYSPRPAAATLLFQRFFRFPLPWVMVVFPRWLMGLFMCLDFLRIPIRETNSSFVSVS